MANNLFSFLADPHSIQPFTVGGPTPQAHQLPRLFPTPTVRAGARNHTAGTHIHRIWTHPEHFGDKRPTIANPNDHH